MFARRNRSLEVLSVSALDLFASALGVFLLMVMLLYPYYLRQPALESELEGAEAELEAAGAALAEAKRMASDAAERKSAAEATRARAVDELQRAMESSAEAEEALARAQARAQEVEGELAGRGPEQATVPITDLDLVFVMDTTKSMREEINDIRASIQGIVRVLFRLAPTLNVGFVVYRDVEERYLTREFPIRPMTDTNVRAIQAFIDDLDAEGGKDWEERVAEGLAKAVAMPFRRDAQGMIIVIGDARAHATDQRRAFELAARFRASETAEGASRRVTTIFTGDRGVDREFFARLARAGGGDAVENRGRIIESVMLSVLDAPVYRLGRR